MTNLKINISLYSLCAIICGSLISCSGGFEGNNMVNEKEEGYIDLDILNYPEAIDFTENIEELWDEEIKEKIDDLINSMEEYIKMLKAKKNFENTPLHQLPYPFMENFIKGYSSKKIYLEDLDECLSKIKWMFSIDANIHHIPKEIYGSPREFKNKRNKYYLESILYILGSEENLTIEKLQTIENFNEKCSKCSRYLPLRANKYYCILKKTYDENSPTLFKQCVSCKKIFHETCLTNRKKDNTCPSCKNCYTSKNSSCSSYIRTNFISIISQLPLDFVEYLKSIGEYYDSKDLTEALRCYIVDYNEKPDDIYSQNINKAVGKLLFLTDECVFNNRSLSKLLNGSGSLNEHKEKSEFLKKSNDLFLALESYKFIYDKKPDFIYNKNINELPDKFISIGDDCFDSLKFDKALECYKWAYNKKPGCIAQKNIDNVISIGDNYFDSLKFDKAFECYDWAYNKKPGCIAQKNIDNVISIGDNYFDSLKFDQALECYKWVYDKTSDNISHIYEQKINDFLSKVINKGELYYGYEDKENVKKALKCYKWAYKYKEKSDQKVKDRIIKVLEKMITIGDSYYNYRLNEALECYKWVWDEKPDDISNQNINEVLDRVDMIKLIYNKSFFEKRAKECFEWLEIKGYEFKKEKKFKDIERKILLTPQKQ